MADGGLRLGRNCYCEMPLCIPPSTKAGMQMVAGDVRETSQIANVRIYVEQAIGRLKQFHILKKILPINSLPLCDDIVQLVCALTSKDQGSTVCLNNSCYSVVYPVIKVNKIKFDQQQNIHGLIFLNFYLQMYI